MLEADLKALFDYQRFERSPALQSVIDSAMDRFVRSEPIPILDDTIAKVAGGTRSLDKNQDREPRL